MLSSRSNSSVRDYRSHDEELWDELQDQMDKLCSDDSSVDEADDLERRSPWLGLEESSDLATAEVLSDASSSSLVQTPSRVASGGGHHRAGDDVSSPRFQEQQQQALVKLIAQQNLERQQRKRAHKSLPKGSITDVSIEHAPCTSLLSLPLLEEETMDGGISPMQSFEAQREESFVNPMIAQMGMNLSPTIFGSQLSPKDLLAQQISMRRLHGSMMAESSCSSNASNPPVTYASHMRGAQLVADATGHPEYQVPIHVCSPVHQPGGHLQCQVKQHQHAVVGSQIRSNSSPTAVWDAAHLRDKPVQRAFTPPVVVPDLRMNLMSISPDVTTNQGGGLSPSSDQSRTPPSEKSSDGKFPVSETGRCSHNAFWTRLRGKRRHSYFYCTYCGVGWRQPTREKQRAAEKLQPPPPIQPIYVSVGAPLHFQSLAAGMPQPMITTMPGPQPEQQPFELRRPTPPELPTVVVPRLHA
eukprot:EG_transcript_8803